jgi:hypothetical protein
MECTGTNVGGIKTPPTPSEVKEYELTKGKKVLSLTLSKKPYEVMVTGEKFLEFRETKTWITSRLIDKKTGKNKEFDLVKFSNGYSKNSPRFYVKFGWFFICQLDKDLQFSNGLKVEVKTGMTVIVLGDIKGIF